MNAYEREEQMIYDRYARGEISVQEYNNELRELAREERAERQEAAERAYRNELEQW